MYHKSGKPFVYGRFRFGGSPAKPGGLSPPPSLLDEFAIEILREFSPTEFIGKLYTRTPSGWIPADLSRISSQSWYKIFLSTKRGLFFDMEGPVFWEVLYFRNESDETGPYVAVALRYAQK